MLAEIEIITAEEKELLDRLADINYAPSISDLVDTSECDPDERLTAGDSVDEPDGNAAAGGDGGKRLEDRPEKVIEDKLDLPNLSSFTFVMPSISKSTVAIKQPFDQNQRENDASDTATAVKPVSSSPTEKQQTGTVESEKLPKIISETRGNLFELSGSFSGGKNE